MEEKHLRNRRVKSPRSDFCQKRFISFSYARQARIRIFLPLAVSISAVLRTAHLPQVLNTVVGLDAVQMIDLLGKAMVYKEEYQAVLPYMKPLSLEIDPDVDIAGPMYHSGILTVPFFVDQLSRLFIISVGRDYVRLQRPPPFWT